VRAQDYVAYAPASLEPAPLDAEGWTRFLADFVKAFPDLQITVEDAVAEGDLVTQRVHCEGTHTGEFQGLPPTSKKVSFSGLLPGPRLLPRMLAHQLKKLRRKG
jgi:SnoaL-like polyketide cyclase